MSATRTTTLADGRVLAYAEYGKPQGWPVFHHHGTPGSRLQGRALHGAAERAGLRLICADRPGFGRSDFQPGRRFVDWPADLVQLADALGIGRFGVSGLSGGGPHALAAAAAVPERVIGVALVSSAPPIDARIARTPRLLRPALRAGVVWFRLTVRPGTALAAFWIARLPAWLLPRTVDPDVLGRAPMRSLVRDEILEAFRHGSRGVAHEFSMHTRPWGIRLGSIETRVSLWHGERDRIVDVRDARALATALPNCTATFIPDGGHLALFDHRDEVFAALAALAR